MGFFYRTYVISIVLVMHLIPAAGQKYNFLDPQSGPKYSYQAGVGIYQQVFYANYYVIGDTLTMDFNGRTSDIRLGSVFLVNRIIKKNFNLETGFRTYDIYYWYRVGTTPKPSGFYIEKLGYVRAMGVDIPLNAELTLLRRFYVKAGLSLSLFHLQKNPDESFSDTPQLNEPYNNLKHTFKPVLFNYGFGAGVIIGRFDLGTYLIASKTKVNNRFKINGKPYGYLYNTVFTTNISLTYHFKLSRKKKQ
jgi:hypothetical protein